MGDSEVKSPAELRRERFDDVRSEWNTLSSRTSLKHLHDELEDVSGRIEKLSTQVSELRSRGYRYSRAWEEQAQALSDGWPERRRQAQRLVREQAREIEGPAKEIEELCNRRMLSDGLLDQVESELDRLESLIDSAERNVRGTFDSLSEQIYAMQRELDRVVYLLDSLDTASFDMYPDELGVAACEAIWTNHPDEPEGILFLTNGRLVYEQREKKAKKKVLFITTESELVQEKLWESAIGNVAELEAEDKKKFLSRKEMLTLSFREYSSGLHGEVTLQLKDTTNEEWAGLIKRTQSGEIEADRYDAPADAGPAEAAAPATPPSEIPTKCPACGGKLPPLVKGMRNLVCEYCDTTVRI